MDNNIDSAQCPQCGMSSAELNVDFKPIVFRVFGNTAKLRCRVCGKFFLHQLGATSEVNHAEAV